jgi:hypothetical protein
MAQMLAMNEIQELLKAYALRKVIIDDLCSSLNRYFATSKIPPIQICPLYSLLEPSVHSRKYDFFSHLSAYLFVGRKMY